MFRSVTDFYCRTWNTSTHDSTAPGLVLSSGPSHSISSTEKGSPTRTPGLCTVSVPAAASKRTCASTGATGAPPAAGLRRTSARRGAACAKKTTRSTRLVTAGGSGGADGSGASDDAGGAGGAGGSGATTSVSAAKAKWTRLLPPCSCA
eukprot:scaffold128573_cov60-Phaeocystis_antarctica.AAC.3